MNAGHHPGLCFSAAVLYLFARRSHYFGNTAPLLTALLSGCRWSRPAPWRTHPLGAPLSVFTFIGGVFADALDSSRLGLLFRWAIVAMVALQALLTIALPALP